MKAATQRTTILLAAAAAVALTAGLATPSLAQGSAGDWRYQQDLAKKAAQRQTTAETGRADRQKAAVGATEFERTRPDHRNRRNGAQRFYIDVPGWEEDQYRGM